jgi:hypothetical protein
LFKKTACLNFGQSSHVLWQKMPRTPLFIKLHMTILTFIRKFRPKQFHKIDPRTTPFTSTTSTPSAASSRSPRTCNPRPPPRPPHTDPFPTKMQKLW